MRFLRTIALHEARFLMGLSAYGAADFNAAASYFREGRENDAAQRGLYNLARLKASSIRARRSPIFDGLSMRSEDAVYLFNLGAVY